MSEGLADIMGGAFGLAEGMIDKLINLAGSHPLNRLVAMNLVDNIIFAMLQPEEPDGGFKLPLEYEHIFREGIFEVNVLTPDLFESRAELLAYLFRKNATVIGDLIVSKQLGDVYKFAGGILKEVAKIPAALEGV